MTLVILMTILAQRLTLLTSALVVFHIKFAHQKWYWTVLFLLILDVSVDNPDVPSSLAGLCGPYADLGPVGILYSSRPPGPGHSDVCVSADPSLEQETYVLVLVI